jgi:hypothetical protein
MMDNRVFTMVRKSDGDWYEDDADQFLQAPSYYPIEEGGQEYTCPRGHTFITQSPLIIAVEDNPDYNSGPICGYCLVDWHRNNVNAETS